MPQWLAVSLFVVAVLVVLAILARASGPRGGAPERRGLRGERLQALTLAVFVGSVLLIVALAAPYPSGMFFAVAVGAVALGAVLWWSRRTTRP